jgi:hypothetical protein
MGNGVTASTIFLTSLPERKIYQVFTWYPSFFGCISLEKYFSPHLFRFFRVARPLELRQETSVHYHSIAIKKK